MIRKFFTNFDMFGAQPTLRMRGESQTINLCGGIASLLILGFFIYIFIIEALQIINYDEIQTMTVNEKNFRLNQSVEYDFVLGLGVRSFNRTLLKQTFSIYVIEYNTGPGYFNWTIIQTEDCTIENLESLGDLAETYYQGYHFEDKICVKKGQKVHMQGILNSFNGVGLSSTYVVTVFTPCHIFGSLQCAGEAFHNATIASKLTNSQYLNADYYLVSTAFNMGQKEPLLPFIENHIYLTFTETFVSEALIQIGTYDITTDDSMLPYVNKTTISGTFVDFDMRNNFQITSEMQYAKVYLTLSANHQSTERIFGKIDDTLSYVGGLFGLIIAFLAFFMMSYNQYRYQIFVAQAFSYKEGSKVKEENFHFFKYLKYVVFDWVKMFGCCEPDWQDCKRIDMAREEAVEQIDVKMLLKRISHLQKLNSTNVSQEEDYCTYLIEGQNIEDLRKRRRITNYYEKLIKGNSPLTMENVNLLENIFMMGSENTSFNISKSVQLIQTQAANQEEKIDKAIKKAGDFVEVDEEQLELDEEDMEIQQQLCDALSKLPKRTRERLQQKIPLKILKRFRQRQKDKEPTDNKKGGLLPSLLFINSKNAQ